MRCWDDRENQTDGDDRRSRQTTTIDMPERYAPVSLYGGGGGGHDRGTLTVTAGLE